ncbi:MAG: ZIP family metal transporter, partial [Thermoleophilaceae bacterium]|nr:ZIP family metal transporter [Thermoleophilaceae bacterium]
MEATTASPKRERPGWLLGLLPLVLLAAAIAAFVALDAPGLDRNGVPVEEVSVDRTVLDPGVIEVHLRNDGPDPVEVRQTIVNDGFSTFTQSSEKIDRLGR